MSEAVTCKLKYATEALSCHLPRYSNNEFDFNQGETNLLGAGGFSEVRKYHHETLQTVAIKQFAITGDAEAISKSWEMVYREIKTLRCFRHENIVEILGITEWPNLIGIVMEYVDGGNLGSLLSVEDQLYLSWNTRLRIAREIISALFYIHNYNETKKFCHGDLKPENVLLTKTLQVKLADFGSAALQRATGALTTTSEFVPSKQYTLIYVAPEFLDEPSRGKNPAMDMYSFGMVLYEMISRRAPYSDCSLPSHLPGLILARIKPTMPLVDQAENLLNSARDSSIFILLKTLMEKCWNDDPIVRLSSKIVQDEIDVFLIQAKDVFSKDPNNSEKILEKREIGCTRSPIFYLKRRSQAFSYFLVFLCLTSLADSPNHHKPTLEELFETRGSDQGVAYLLQQYERSLRSRKFDEAETFKSKIRLLFVNSVDATAEDVRLNGIKLRGQKRYLESIVIFDAAAVLFGKMENPVQVLNGIGACVGGINKASNSMISDDVETMTIVKYHVIPLMRDWLRQMESTSEVSEKSRCHYVSRSLRSIKSSEALVDQLEVREKTPGVVGAEKKKVLETDNNKQHGRLFGDFLSNIGAVCRDTSRFKEATLLFIKRLRLKTSVDHYNEDKRNQIIEKGGKNLETIQMQRQ